MQSKSNRIFFKVSRRPVDKMLPSPKDKLGYTKEEIKQICKDRNIKLKDFWKYSLGDTCAIGKDGTLRYYKCDVERILYSLNGKDGKFHVWD